jgi:hypothetical protein
MVEQVTRLRVFVISPNDVNAEQKRLHDVIDELNRGIAADRKLVLELVRWETHVAPDMGRPEQVVLNQIGPYDILVGIMWKRFGTPTGVAGSGTEEEFNVAYDLWQKHKKPRILFYFNQSGPLPHPGEPAKQFDKVLDFKARLQGLGLTWDYIGPDEFEKMVRGHLTKVIRERGKDEGGAMLPQPPILITSIEPPRRDFLVQDGKRRRIPDNPTLRAVMKKLGVREIRPLSEKEIYEYPCGDAVPSEAPRVVQDSGGTKYLVAREEKGRIPNDETLKALSGDARSSVPSEDEYLASLREGLPLPEQLGEKWFTSEPRLERLDLGFISEFLVCGRICRYIPKPAWVDELMKRLSISRIEIDKQKLESYVEGVPIGSERDIRTVLLQLCAKGSGGAFLRD